MEKQVTIVIPNYNGLSFMEMCFASLKKQTYKAFAVLVVDNGSTDGSVEWLKENKIPTIFLPKNTGFTGAVNVGLREVKTPYVILLNNDIEAAPQYVEYMVKAISRSKKIFSVSSKMIQLHHRDGWTMRVIYTPFWDGQHSVAWVSHQADIHARLAFFLHAQLRPSTGVKYLTKSGILTKCILHIWKIWMWDTAQGLPDMTIFTVRMLWCIMWEAEQAARDTILLRYILLRETMYI